MSGRIKGSYEDALYKSMYTLLSLLYHYGHVRPPARQEATTDRTTV